MMNLFNKVQSTKALPILQNKLGNGDVDVLCAHNTFPIRIQEAERTL